MSDRLRGHLGFKGVKGEIGNVGTPRVYSGSFRDLQVDLRVNKEYYYILVNPSEELNGHWFYYDEDKEFWIDGGLYQAKGIAEKSITFNMLSEDLQRVLRPLIGGIDE